MKSKMYKIIGVAVVVIVGIFISYVFYMDKTVESRSVDNLVDDKDGDGFAVFELFVSEGCDKCPAAEELISKIQQENLDKPLYILTYHIDYWDVRGWKDKYGKAVFSQRQRQYARWLNSTVYTPQLIVNGSKEFVGSNEQLVNRAIIDEFSRKNPTSLRIVGDLAGNTIKVKYDGINLLDHEEVVVVLIEKEGKTEVKSGPNSGKLLSHIQLAHTIVKMDNLKKENIIQLPVTFNSTDWELIAFVQSNLNGRIRDACRYDFK